jgi:hypothetical protein
MMRTEEGDLDGGQDQRLRTTNTETFKVVRTGVKRTRITTEARTKE